MKTFRENSNVMVVLFTVWLSFLRTQVKRWECGQCTKFYHSGFSRQANLTDLSDLTEKSALFRNFHNLNFKAKGCLIFPVLVSLCALHQIINKKVLLRERKRHTNRSVSSTLFVTRSGVHPPARSDGGGGYPRWGTPGRVPSGKV